MSVESIFTEQSLARDLGRRALRGSAWLTGSQVLIGGMSILRDLLVARLVLPEAFGLMALVRFFLGTIQQPFELNLDVALIHRRERIEEATVAHAWLKGGLALAAFLLMLAGQGLLRRWYEPRVVHGLLILGASSILQAVGSTSRTLLERQLRLGSLSRLMVTNTVLQASVAVLLARSGAGFWSLLIADVVAMVVPAIGCWWLARPKIGRAPSPDLLRWYLNFSWPMWLAGLLTVFIFTIDDFFVATFAGATVLGLYSMAYDMMKWPAQLITHVLNRAWLPVYARLQTDRTSLSALYNVVLFWMAQLSIPVSVALAFVAPELIQCVLGNRWLGSAAMMRILVLYAIARSIQDDMINLMLALGHVRVALRVQWVEAVLMLGGGLIAGRIFGALGICWVVNVMMLSGLVVLVRLLQRFVDLQIYEILGAALISSGMAVAVLGCLVPAQWFSTHPWAQLVGKTLAFFGLYGVSFWVLNRQKLAAKWTLLQQLWKGESRLAYSARR